MCTYNQCLLHALLHSGLPDTNVQYSISVEYYTGKVPSAFQMLLR